GDGAEAVAGIAVVVRDAGVAVASPTPAAVPPAGISPTAEAHVLCVGRPGGHQDNGEGHDQGPPRSSRAYEEALHCDPPSRSVGQAVGRKHAGSPISIIGPFGGPLRAATAGSG